MSSARASAGPVPLAPLWARIMLAAGWAILSARAGEFVAAQGAGAHLAVEVAAALALAVVLASGEPRITRKGVAAYAVAWLAPSLLRLAPHPLADLFGGATVAVAAVCCTGGVAAARALPPRDRDALRVAQTFAGGAVVTFLVLLALAGSFAPGVIRPPGAQAQADLALHAFFTTAPLMIVMDLVRWDARRREGFPTEAYTVRAARALLGLKPAPPPPAGESAAAPAPAPPAPEKAPRPAHPPFAPLWTRVMLAAGWAVIGMRTSDAARGGPEALHLALTVAASLAIGAIAALAEPRVTRRCVAAYALAWLLPSLASYAVPLSSPASRSPPELGRTIVAHVLGLLCLGGVTAVRAAALRARPGWVGGTFLYGAGLTLVASCVLGCATGALLSPFRLGKQADEALGALVGAGALMVALDLVRWTTRGRPDDGSWAARLARAPAPTPPPPGATRIDA